MRGALSRHKDGARRLPSCTRSVQSPARLFGPAPSAPRQQSLDAQSFIPAIDKLRKDESIAGVVLRIDSPGGEAIASEQMLRAVRQLAEEKPLVVSMSTLAASGGYYIASVPEVPIVAYPGTYTGSIGVFALVPKLHGPLREDRRHQGDSHKGSLCRIGFGL